MLKKEAAKQQPTPPKLHAALHINIILDYPLKKQLTFLSLYLPMLPLLICRICLIFSLVRSKNN